MIVVIGAGAAGLMAAAYAARGGKQVVVLERNEKAGKKIYITGKGRCNVTNTADLDGFLAAVVCNPRFMYSAYSFLSPDDVQVFLAQNGCQTVVERGGRVFPASNKASDVTAALLRAVRGAGASIRTGARVTGVRQQGEGFVVDLPGESIAAEAVIIATGGLSYPATGSTGDGYGFAESLGHQVTQTRPSLVSLQVTQTDLHDLAGLSLKNVQLCAAWKKGKFGQMGEMLFTHTGISGPLALTLSAHLPEDLEGVEAYIDLKPALSLEQLDERLVRELSTAPNRTARNILPALAPKSLAEAVAARAEFPVDAPCRAVDKASRGRLARELKHLSLTITGRGGWEEAIITRGGVAVKQVDPGTMASKLVPGLYFAGEVLDLDAVTGGYNLQIALSTGALAGASAGAD